MTRSIFPFILIVVLTMAFSTIAKSQESNAKIADNIAWRARMQKMLGAVETLIPYAFEFDRSKFYAENKDIRTALQTLANNAAGIREHVTAKDSARVIDPSFRFIAIAFENEIGQTQVGFSKGTEAIEETKRHLRIAISKCMLCHTQSTVGPSLDLERFKNRFSTLTPPSRILALAATRQFESALKTFTEMARDAKLFKPDANAFDSSARTAVSIAVRVLRDPKQGLTLVKAIEDSGAGSPTLQSNLAGWKRDLLDWQRKPKQNLNTDNALFDEASRLRTATKSEALSSSSIRNFEVAHLRASGLLHDLLSTFPKSSLRAQAYLELAKIYSDLPGFAIWELSDDYLGTCIQENPHSDIAETCYKQYEENVFLGYTGSSGTNIPTAVQSHLKAMKALATK